jgi:uncharacterized protein (DUF433 family)
VNLKDLAESRIVIDQDICGGKARIRGTRVIVADVLLSLAEGMSNQDILRNFRSIQEKDIQACLAYCFCITDGIKLLIGSSFDGSVEIGEGEKILTKEETKRIENDVFSQVLEEQALIQEEITKEKVEKIKQKKQAKSKAPVLDQKAPPQQRPYDLLIDISAEKATKIFSDDAHIEQGLDMQLDNYLFEKRNDNKLWLTYSIKEGVEIDQAMKRNLLVTYSASDGKLKEAVFEGYLTTDRQNKVFIQKTVDGKTCGRAL